MKKYRKCNFLSCPAFMIIAVHITLTQYLHMNFLL